jgi:hypothetical protein
MSLISCPECSRHIRTSESACPFCEADVASVISNAAARTMPAVGLSRAAMMAFAAASLGAAGCSSSDNAPSGGNQPLTDGAVDGSSGKAGASNTGGQMAIPVYGAPFPSGGTANAGGTSNAGGTNQGTGNVAMALYGAPFPPPGGAPNTGGATSTAGSGGIMVMPLYGASPVPTSKP